VVNDHAHRQGTAAATRAISATRAADKPTMTQRTATPIACLLGPTASGKTAAALALAARRPVEIISVDSALVYREMDIGTAKPTVEEQARVRHHLIDIVDPADAYSAAEFRTDTLRLVSEISTRGRVPLLVGGTMLYYKALTQGLSDLPSADPEIRAALDADGLRDGWPALHARLAAVDAATAARLAPNDSQRIQRALEVFMLTGQPMSALLAAPARTDEAALPWRWSLRIAACCMHGLRRGLMPCSRLDSWKRLSDCGRAGICVPGCRRCGVWGIGRFGNISMGMSISRPCGIREFLLRGSCASGSLRGCGVCPRGLLLIVVRGMLLNWRCGLLKRLLGGDFFCPSGGVFACGASYCLVCLRCWPFLAFLVVCLPAAPRFVWCAYGVGLSLHCYRSISFAPVRGGTYFSLPAAKKSRQKKAGSNRQPVGVHHLNQPGVVRDETVTRISRVSDTGLIHPTPHCVRRGWVCLGRRRDASKIEAGGQ
jgi:hypothetical protein